MASYKVVEQFVSINGEGTRAGQLAVFIRFHGCNLNCVYCDTSWANKDDCKYDLLSEIDIIDYILSTGITNVTLTGGEPLAQADISCLLTELSKHPQLAVEIETNGSISLSDYVSYLGNQFRITMDYKLPYSKMEVYMYSKNIDYLIKDDTIKFVVGDIDDLNRAKQIIDTWDLTTRCHVYISPVFGHIAPEDIVEYMKDHKMNNINFQLQMHKFIWDPNERGV